MLLYFISVIRKKKKFNFAKYKQNTTQPYMWTLKRPTPQKQREHDASGMFEKAVTNLVDKY